LYTPACTFQSCTLLEAFPTPFPFLYSSAHIPSSTLLEKIKATKTTASQGNKEKAPTGKRRRNGASQGCIVPE
jgi:hypothetical protein